MSASATEGGHKNRDAEKKWSSHEDVESVRRWKNFEKQLIS